MSESQKVPLAVVGVSTLLPGSTDAGGFWRDVFAGTDRIGPVPAERWLIEDYYDPDPTVPDKTYARRGAFLSPVDFDALGFGMPPNLAPTTDSTQLLALIVAQQVLDDATRGQFAQMDRSKVSCILGVTSAQELLGTMVARLQKPVWQKALRETGLPEDEVQAACKRISDSYVPWQESTFPGVLGNVIAGRIANRFDLRGTNCVTDAACASAFSALSMAANELWLGDSDLVITGGCDTMNDIFMFMCFSKTPALSPTEDCRPFSDNADGTMLGEGLAMIALKRLADAERDGDAIYAVIRGVGSSSDGRAKSVYAPVADGQARALRRAYDNAGYGPQTVELVEAHGTGTKAGDAAEFEGLRSVFAPSAPDRTQWCALGSVKSQIGHTKSTAGAAGLVKAVLALRHGVLPPTLKVERPNPKLNLEQSPFYLSTQTRPWVRDASHPRRASVSSFGFGGTNFHIALEEYTGPGARADRWATWKTEVITLGAASAAELGAQIGALALDDAPAGSLRAAAYRSHHTLDRSSPYRLAVHASTEAEAAKRLALAGERIARDPETAFSTPDGVHYGVGAPQGPLAVLCAGQGAQYVGMGADLAMAFDDARAVWDVAAGVDLGDAMRLHEVVFPRPVFSETDRDAQGARLTATEWAQPALGAAAAATLAVLKRLGVEPAFAAGHSFGELSALYAAGAWDLPTLIAAARARGSAMANAAASTSGAMTALATDITQARALVAGIDGAVVANHNAPNQVVASGTLGAIQALEDRAAAAGVSARRLNVSTAFHSPLVASARDGFAAFLAAAKLGAIELPVVSNLTADTYAPDGSSARELLAEQLTSPVRYVEQLERLWELGARVFVEVGPASIQTRLVQQTLGDRARAVATDQRGRNGVAALFEALAQLHAAGVAVAFDRIWDRYRAPVDPRTLSTPRGAIKVGGGNVGSPYPPRGGASALPGPNPPRSIAPAVAAAPPSAPGAAAIPPSTMQNPPRPPAAPAVQTEVAVAWVTAFADLQRQTAEAHAAWQRAMSESHVAFLRTAEASLNAMNALVGGAPLPLTSIAPPAPVYAAPVPQAAPPAHLVAAPSVAIAPPVPVYAAPPVAPVAAPPPVAPVAASAARPAPSATPSADPAAVMLAVVADKTGYPVEMLNLDMALEADLGVDSIKRVEILSAVQDRLPGLAADPQKLNALVTLREVVAALGGGAPPSAAVTPAPAPSNGVHKTPAPTVAAPQGATDAAGALLAVVADKTGYPVEMLNLDMALEADLGVDSIKRVEILSALADRAPHLPQPDASRSATLVTLRDIANYMAAGASSPSPTPAGASGVSPHPKVGRFDVVGAPAPRTGTAMYGLGRAPGAVVIGSADGLAPSLVAELGRRGLTARLNGEPRPGELVVSLEALGTFATPRAALDALSAVFATARRCAAAFADHGGLFVAAFDHGGRLGLDGIAGNGVFASGVTGIVKTAALEWPAVACKAVDIACAGRSPEAVCASLADEIYFGGPELEVGLDPSGARTTLTTELNRGAPATCPVGPGDLVVVSGGARGVTAACVVALARAARPTFALLGRTALHDEPHHVASAADAAGIKRALLEHAKASGTAVTPAHLGAQTAEILAGREVRATLAAIAQAGGSATYLPVDVRDRAALTAALAPLRAAHGPVRAVVHGAGVLADKLIAQKADDAWHRVVDTKVDGLEALLDVTGADPLRAIVLFSSVAARTGNVGQSDYAAANEILNRRAWQLRAARPDCTVVSMGWGPWRGGMVDHALEARFDALGVPLIELDAGAHAFVDALSCPGSAEAVLGGAPRRVPLATGGEVIDRAEIRVSGAQLPWLLDHQVAGALVVPMAAAVDWMVRFAEGSAPGFRAHALDDVKVLRPIRLGPDETLVLTVQAARRPDGRVAVELLNAAGQGLYRALIAVQPGDPRIIRPSGSRFVGDASHYGATLFHGPSLRVLGEAERIDADGAIVPVGGLGGMSWPADGWRTDMPAVDGALQMALAWTEVRTGRASLPMSIEQIERRSDATPGVFKGVLRGRSSSSNGAVCDVDLVDSDGQIVYALRGVSTVVIPGARA